MSKRLAFTQLLSLTAIVMTSALFLGCSETLPVSSPFTQTTLQLTPRAFPSPPDGMIYELWVQRSNGDNKSLGRFGWDQILYIMRDDMGVKRERAFNLDFNILEWEFLSVSVEVAASASSGTPGPIFLRDRIAAPATKKFLYLEFPLGYDTSVTGFVSMETPSDGNVIGDKSGLWFAIYSQSSTRLQDTTQVRVFRGARNNPNNPSQIPRDTAADTENGTTLDTIGIDSVMMVTYRRYTRFNLDTFVINAVRPYFKIVPINNTADSINYIFGDFDHRDTVDYGVNMDFVFFREYDTLQSLSFSVHTFNNGFTDLPTLGGDVRWHYKGWVLGPNQGTGPASFVRMNFGENKELNWEKPGRLLFTTGVFKDTVIESTLVRLDTIQITVDSILVINIYDYRNETGYHLPQAGGANLIESNPYASNLRASLPPYPGEDFLANLPVVSIDTAAAFNFKISNDGADTAIAFISIEPDNYTDTTRNFPLIVLARELAPRGADGNDPYNNIKLFNQSGVTKPFVNDRKSWPHIVVEHTLE